MKKIITMIGLLAALCSTQTFGLLGLTNSTYHFHVSMSENANIDAKTKTPAPIDVAFYYLGSKTHFLKADYFSLVGSGGKALQQDIIGSKQLILIPSQSKTVEVSIPAGAQYIGVVAGYNDLNGKKWRQVVNTASSLHTAYTVNVTANGIQVSADKASNKPRHFYIGLNGGYAAIATVDTVAPFVPHNNIDMRAAKHSGSIFGISAGYQFQRHPQQRWDIANRFSIGIGVNYLPIQLAGDAYALNTNDPQIPPHSMGQYFAKATTLHYILMLSTDMVQYDHIALQVNGGVGYSMHTNHIHYSLLPGEVSTQDNHMIYQLGLGVVYHLNHAFSLSASYQTIFNDTITVPFDAEQAPVLRLTQSFAQLGVKYSF